MKRFSIKAILTCCFAAAFVACADVWEEHYQPNPALNGSETLWELISSDPELEDFAALLHETGYDTLLTKNRNYTVWAPADLSDLIDINTLSSVDEELLEVYRKEIVENHIADYSHVAGGIRDKEKEDYERVLMLNGKSYHFEGAVGRSYEFGGHELEASNIVAKNGVLHKLGKGVPFAANIWEQLAKEPSISKLHAFLNKDFKRVFSEGASIKGPIVDGLQTYLDSVFYDECRWFWKIGQLNNEDSTYTMYALTDKAWDEMYEEMRGYFAYPNIMSKDDGTGVKPLEIIGDSIVRELMCENLVFSNTVNRKFFRGERDTLISTRYGRFINDDAYALHDGCVKELTMSNGTLHLIDKVNYKPITWGYDTLRMQADYVSKVDKFPDTRTNTYRGMCEDATVKSEAFERGDSLYDKLTGNRVGIFEATNNENKVEQPKIRFYMDNLLSAYYQISIVILPANFVDPTDTVFVKPNKFKASLNYCLPDGTYKEHKFTNTRDLVDHKNKPVEDKEIFMNDITKVDTIVLAEKFKFESCQFLYELYTGVAPQTYIEIATDIDIRSSSRGENNAKYPRDPKHWNYDNRYRIDEVIFTPIEEPVSE